MLVIYIILTTITAILINVIHQKWKDYSRKWKYAIHVPGPKGVPILGNIPEVAEHLKNNTFREKRMEECLKYKYIHRHYALGKIIFMVYNPQDLETIMSNPKLLTKGEPYDILHPWLGAGLLTSSGSKWQYRRKILTPAFHFSILQDFLEIFNRETDNLVEDLKQHIGQPVNVIKPITEFTLSSIGETSLGVNINKEENCKNYKNAIYEMGELFVQITMRPWLQTPFIGKLHPLMFQTRKTIKILHNFSKNVIQKRKKQVSVTGSYSTNKRLALLDLLLRARDKEGIDIDDEGIREEVDTFMFEGHDTTALSLCYTLVILANEPKVQDEIYQEIIDIIGESKKYPDTNDLANMTFMERCIKESLRLYPSVPNVLRRVTEDIKTKDGYILPKGTDVDLSMIETHRMPHLWEDPLKFDPDRFLPENIAKRHPFAYVPFSAGPRNCIGQKYAMLEIKTALCGILRAFKPEPVTKCSELRFKMDIVLRPLGEVKVKFQPRS